MTGKTRENWTSTNIRITLVKEIKKMLKTNAAKRQGLTNVSQFIDASIRDMLARLEPSRMSEVNTYKDHVKIMDNDLDGVGRIVSVHFKKGRSSWCDYCKRRTCIHVQYSWEIPEAKAILKKYGLKPPPSKA